MTTGTIVLVVLIILLIGAFLLGVHSRSAWGYGPTGVVGFGRRPRYPTGTPVI